MHPDPKRRSEDDVVDVRSADEGLPRPETVRAVLESAADVIFTDGVSREFLDQWTFETVQLLEARAESAKRTRPTRRTVTAAR